MTDFVKGLHTIRYPTVEELADKYDCSVKTIYDRISRDRCRGIGDWRKHRKSIAAKRKEEIISSGSDGGRLGFYTTTSAKLDAIALESLEETLVLNRLGLSLLKMQREEDLKLIEANPDNIKKVNCQGQSLRLSAQTIAAAIETARKIVGEPVTGIASEQQQGAIASSTTDTANRSKEVDRLLKRREQLAKRIEKMEKMKAVDPPA